MIAAVALPRLGDGDKAAALSAILTAGAVADALWLRAKRSRIPRARARFSELDYALPERSNVLAFRSTPEILEQGGAGCGEAARVVAAVIIAEGGDAAVVVQPRKVGGEFHAVVRFDDGTIYDPTREMRGKT